MGLFGRDTQPSPATPTGAQQRPGPRIQGAPSATTTVAAGTRIEGTLTGSSNVTVEGELEGAVAISGTFHVAQSGQVKASVRARNVTVSGRVDGDLSSDEKIQLEPSGVVHGNLVSPRILILDGAELQGQVVMSKPTGAAPETAGKKPVADETSDKKSGQAKKK